MTEGGRLRLLLGQSRSAGREGQGGRHWHEVVGRHRHALRPVSLTPVFMDVATRPSA
jgi:hypothetical protein